LRLDAEKEKKNKGGKKEGEEGGKGAWVGRRMNGRDQTLGRKKLGRGFLADPKNNRGNLSGGNQKGRKEGGAD